MLLIKYSRNQRSETETNLVDYEPAKPESNQMLFKSGELYLISYPDYEQNATWLKSYNFHDCGIKGSKIELFRALGFDRENDRDKRKKLSVNTNSTGAFKRSISAFLNNRYSMSDPCCLLVVNQQLLSDISAGIYLKKNRKFDAHPGRRNDPVLQLIEEAEENPAMEEIRESLLGNSYDIRLARTLILKAANSTEPVLILGESGTGKDVVAKLIVKHDKKFGKIFSSVNCAALPDTLLEGELFGYKKGIFTGANIEKIGLFVATEGGTVFLDEVGELSPANQAKLLLAVESKIIRQIGSNESKQTNFRILAATNRNIDHMVIQEQFRDDLLQRLNTIRISIPPLRSHPEDIPMLADHFWSKLSTSHKLSEEFHQQLKAYSWPGNVRELKTFLNSVRDIFSDISPGPEHFHAIWKMRAATPPGTARGAQQDASKLLRLESQLRLTNLQNIIRGIKVSARPVLNGGQKTEISKNAYRQLKTYISGQIVLIDELCLEPVYFAEYGLFKDITRFRYLLEKMVNTWPPSAGQFDPELINGLKNLYEIITRKILELVWGKTDL